MEVDLSPEIQAGFMFVTKCEQLASCFPFISLIISSSIYSQIVTNCYPDYTIHKILNSMTSNDLSCAGETCLKNSEITLMTFSVTNSKLKGLFNCH